MQNIVKLAGNIGQNPEARTTQCGNQITNFSLAISPPPLGRSRDARRQRPYAWTSTR